MHSALHYTFSQHTNRAKQMTNLTQLAHKWQAAKADENAARDARILIEQDIIEHTGVRDEGARRHAAGDCRITVTGRMTRTLDADKWREIEHSIPEALRPIRYQPTLDVGGLRYLQDNEPDVYAAVADAVTVKPGKPGVSVAPIKGAK